MASRNGISGLLNFKIFWGTMPPDPPRDWRHRRASGLPPRTQICSYGHAISLLSYSTFFFRMGANPHRVLSQLRSGLWCWRACLVCCFSLYLGRFAVWKSEHLSNIWMEKRNKWIDGYYYSIQTVVVNHGIGQVFSLCFQHSILHKQWCIINILCTVISFRAKLQHNAALLQLPIGLEGEHQGVVDVIRRKAYYFGGQHGWVLNTRPSCSAVKTKEHGAVPW